MFGALKAIDSLPPAAAWISLSDGSGAGDGVGGCSEGGLICGGT
jgi:hypothetical protein